MTFYYAVKAPGSDAVLCGIKNTSETEYEAVVVDPESEKYNTAE